MLIGTGYSGNGVGKNNPDYQTVHDVGPIPVGQYTILAPIDTVSHGPYVMELVPDPENEMWGRAGFLLHGDSLEHPGNASKGCPVAVRAVREAIWGDPEHRLKVAA